MFTMMPASVKAGGVAPSTYAAVVAADSPTAWWRLNDVVTNGGNAVDASGNGNTGSYTVGAADLAAQPGASIVSGSSRSYAKTGASPGGVTNASGVPGVTVASSYSVEAWFRWNSNANQYQMLFDMDTNNRIFQLRLNSGKVEFVNIRNSVVTVTSPASYGDNARHHAVVTVDGSATTNNINMYVDGVLVATASGDVGGAMSSSFEIGRYSSNDGYQFQGLLADVALYPVALSAGRVTSHWDAGK